MVYGDILYSYSINGMQNLTVACLFLPYSKKIYRPIYIYIYDLYVGWDGWLDCLANRWHVSEILESQKVSCCVTWECGALAKSELHFDLSQHLQWPPALTIFFLLSTHLFVLLWQKLSTSCQISVYRNCILARDSNAHQCLNPLAKEGSVPKILSKVLY